MGFVLVIAFVLALLISKVVLSCWVLPSLAYLKLKKRGFNGPTPSFPLGNINEMKKKNNLNININNNNKISSLDVSNDIHSTVFPYFARWQQSYGKENKIFFIIFFLKF